MVSDKRRRTIRKDLVRFFAPDPDPTLRKIYGNPAEYLDIMPPAALIKLLRNCDALEQFLKYARSHKKAVQELEVEDIEAAQREFAVELVMTE